MRIFGTAELQDVAGVSLLAGIAAYATHGGRDGVAIAAVTTIGTVIAARSWPHPVTAPPGGGDAGRAGAVRRDDEPPPPPAPSAGGMATLAALVGGALAAAANGAAAAAGALVALFSHRQVQP